MQCLANDYFTVVMLTIFDSQICGPNDKCLALYHCMSLAQAWSCVHLGADHVRDGMHSTAACEQLVL